MRIKGNQIRPGYVLEHQGTLWRVATGQHVTPGKGGAFYQAELRNVKTGSKLNERFRAGEEVERVSLEQRDYQYLFAEGDLFTFMDKESYEQIQVERTVLGDAAAYLQDGMEVVIETFEGRPLSVQIPEQVILEITETESVVKGQTAASSYKPALLSNGVRTQVPPFVGTGERIAVSTADGHYIKRAD